MLHITSIGNHNITSVVVSYVISLLFLLFHFRASVKLFVSLQFLNPNTVGRTPWIGDQPVARPLPNTNTE
jgi:hypothetical protein